MKTKNLRLFLITVCVLSGIRSANAAPTIISDSFTGTDGSTLNGRTPDGADLPGRTYSAASENSSGSFAQPVIDTGSGNPSPSARTGFNGATFIDISSTGSYTKPSLLTLGLDLQMNTIANDGGAVRGIGLGFFSPTPAGGGNADSNFTGLTVRPDGSLHLVKQGVQQLATVAAFAGFSIDTFYTLTYSVDTSTGSITNVLFNGNDDTATFSGGTSAGDFTPAVTNLTGFYGSTANNAGLFGRVDNYSVSAVGAEVPEPSTWALILGGLATLCSRRRRKTATLNV